MTSIFQRLSNRWLLAFASTLALLAPNLSAQVDATSTAAATGKTADKTTGTESVRPQIRINTNHGSFTLELYPRKAPVTVGNFLQLVEDGFYTNLLFHRVIANFMVQAGGYDLDMVYQEPPRTLVNESFNGLSNRKGFIAMARTEDPDSADTQFFINVRDNARLDAQPGKPGYTVFGRVIDGWRVVESIELVDTGISQGMSAVPMEPVVLESAERVR